MKSIHAPRDREEIVARINRVDPAQPAKWGKMTAPQMMAHLTSSMNMGLGELAVGSKKSPIRFFPLKQLIIYVLPFPKSAPTAKELITRAPAEWQKERSDLLAAIRRFADLAPNASWPDHPLFGKMSRSDWGVLGYKHFDHHLRQFGA